MKKKVKPAIALEPVRVFTQMLSTSSMIESPSIDVVRPAKSRVKPGWAKAALIARSPRPRPRRRSRTAGRPRDARRCRGGRRTCPRPRCSRPVRSASSSGVSQATCWVSPALSRQPGIRLALARAEEAVDPPLEQHPAQRLAGAQLVTAEVVVLGPRHPDVPHLPRPLASRAAGGLLDEVVLGELAQVPRAVGRGLVEPVGELGGGHRAVDGQQLDDPHPDGMGDGGEGAGVAEAAGRWASVESTLSKESLQ